MVDTVKPYMDKRMEAHSLHTFKSNYTEIRNIRKADHGSYSAPSQEKKTPNSCKFHLLFVMVLSQVATLLFPDLQRLETHISQSKQEDNRIIQFC